MKKVCRECKKKVAKGVELWDGESFWVHNSCLIENYEIEPKVKN